MRHSALKCVVTLLKSSIFSGSSGSRRTCAAPAGAPSVRLAAECGVALATRLVLQTEDGPSTWREQ
jgi:hypothetical protein